MNQQNYIGQNFDGDLAIQYAIQHPKGNVDYQGLYKTINAKNGSAPQDYATVSQVATGTSQPLNIISTSYPNTGNVDMNSKKLINLANGTTSNDAINYNQLQDLNHIQNTGANSIITVQNTDIIDIYNNGQTSTTHIQADVDGGVDLQNGTSIHLQVSSNHLDMTTSGSSFNQNLSMTNHLINNVLDPVSNQDAATKIYVDSQISPFATDQIHNTSDSVIVLADTNDVKMTIDNTHFINFYNQGALTGMSVDSPDDLQIRNSNGENSMIMYENGVSGTAFHSSVGFHFDNLVDMSTTNKIINLADPTLDQDAVTKIYVDDKNYIHNAVTDETRIETTDAQNINIKANSQQIQNIQANGTDIKLTQTGVLFDMEGDNTQGNSFQIQGNRADNGTFNQTSLGLIQKNYSTSSNLCIIHMGLDDNTGGAIDFGTGTFLFNPPTLQSASFIQSLSTGTQAMAISAGQALANNTMVLYADNNVATYPVQTQFNRKTGHDGTITTTLGTQFADKDYVDAQISSGSVSIQDLPTSFNNQVITSATDIKMLLDQNTTPHQFQFQSASDISYINSDAPTTIIQDAVNSIIYDNVQGIELSTPLGVQILGSGLNMNSNKITGLQAATNPSDAVRYDQLTSATTDHIQNTGATEKILCDTSDIKVTLNNIQNTTIEEDTSNAGGFEISNPVSNRLNCNTVDLILTPTQIDAQLDSTGTHNILLLHDNTTSSNQIQSDDALFIKSTTGSNSIFIPPSGAQNVIFSAQNKFVMNKPLTMGTNQIQTLATAGTINGSNTNAVNGADLFTYVAAHNGDRIVDNTTGNQTQVIASGSLGVQYTLNGVTDELNIQDVGGNVVKINGSNVCQALQLFSQPSGSNQCGFGIQGSSGSNLIQTFLGGVECSNISYPSNLFTETFGSGTGNKKTRVQSTYYLEPITAANDILFQMASHLNIKNTILTGTSHNNSLYGDSQTNSLALCLSTPASSNQMVLYKNVTGNGLFTEFQSAAFKVGYASTQSSAVNQEFLTKGLADTLYSSSGSASSSIQDTTPFNTKLLCASTSIKGFLLAGQVTPGYQLTDDTSGGCILSSPVSMALSANTIRLNTTGPSQALQILSDANGTVFSNPNDIKFIAHSATTAANLSLKVATLDGGNGIKAVNFVDPLSSDTQGLVTVNYFNTHLSAGSFDFLSIISTTNNGTGGTFAQQVGYSVTNSQFTNGTIAFNTGTQFITLLAGHSYDITVRSYQSIQGTGGGQFWVYGLSTAALIAGSQYLNQSGTGGTAGYYKDWLVQARTSVIAYDDLCQSNMIMTVGSTLTVGGYTIFNTSVIQTFGNVSVVIKQLN